MKIYHATGLSRALRLITKLASNKRPALTKFSQLLLELANHGVMGVAVGLAFAFLVTHVARSGVATLISQSQDPGSALLNFIGACAATFGIGAASTGSIMTLTEKKRH